MKKKVVVTNLHSAHSHDLLYHFVYFDIQFSICVLLGFRRVHEGTSGVLLPPAL